MEWQVKKLGDVCRLINGRAYKKHEMLSEGKYPLLRVGNFFSNRSWYYSDLELDDDKYCDKGDLLYAWSASFGPRVWDGSKVIYHYHIWKIELNHGLVDKKYLFHLLDWDTEQIKAEQGTGSTMLHVTKGAMENRLLPFPTISEQKRIVAILDEIFADIEQVRAKTEQNLKNARELFESYLQQVFSQRGEGWNIKQVSDIADTVLGKMLDKKKNKGTFKPYLRNLNVQWFDINIADLLDMRFEDSEYERYSIKKGDLVICEGGYPGRGAIWNNEEDIFFQKALHRVRSHKSIYNRWILYYLYLSDKNGELKKSFTGAGIQHFTGRALKALKIPVPTESMANKYIEKIDRIFNEVQLLENNYIRKLAGIDELKKSILQKAFSGELTKTSDNKTKQGALA